MNSGKGGRHCSSVIMTRPAGLEPATYGFEGRRSIQLSYGRIFSISHGWQRAVFYHSPQSNGNRALNIVH
jgi:hypothetical protein